MKVAISLEKDGHIYTGNPWTAPNFVIYEITQYENLIEYKKLEEKENPWLEEDESLICDPMMCSDGCSDIIKADINHLADHYIILEIVNGCSYLLANTFCSNVEKVLRNGDIKIHQFPVFIKNPDMALNNFIVSEFKSGGYYNRVNFKIKKIENKENFD